MKKLVLCYFALLLCTLSAVSLVAASSKNQLMPKTVKNIPNNSQLKFSEANEDDDDGEEEEGEDFDDYDNDDDDEDSSAEEQYQLKFKSRKLSRPAKINKAPAKSDIVLKQNRQSFFRLDRYLKSSNICANIRCERGEYCFVPKAGVAECLKQSGEQSVLKPALATGNHRSTLIDLDSLDPVEDNYGNVNKFKANMNEYNNKNKQQVESESHSTNGFNYRQPTVEEQKKQSKQKFSGKTEDDEDDYDDDDDGGGGGEFKSKKALNGRIVVFAKQSQQYNNSKIVQCPSCPFGKGQIVCGTDNATYSSMCRLEFHNCVHRSTVKFACFGFCPCMKVYQKVLIKPTNNSVAQQQPRAAPGKSISLKSQYYGQNNDERKKMKLKKDSATNSVLAKKVFGKTVKNRKPAGRKQASLYQNRTYQNEVLRQWCSTEQLRSMGLRLLDWFLVVMNEEFKRKKISTKFTNKTRREGDSLAQLMQRKYLPECEEQVSFMFYHFDTDRDFKLSTKELYYLEHDENEHCLEPYLSQCDEDGDEYLSAYEWCSCFSLKAKPCLYHQKHSTKEGLIGGYVPQCTDKGHYQKVQCQASTNYCWCSDKNGNEIAGTRVRGQKPLCEKTYPLNRNRFYKNKFLPNEPKLKPVEKKQPASRQSEIHEDMEDGDDDDDDIDNFNVDHGSGSDSF